MARKVDQKTMALISFCSAIEEVGGVWKTPSGSWVPMLRVQPSLDALGEAYLDACLALDRLPKTQKEQPYGEG